jgi:hypothetical protein
MSTRGRDRELLTSIDVIPTPDGAIGRRVAQLDGVTLADSGEVSLVAMCEDFSAAV